jgi:ERCC4-type nuclease
MTTAATTRRRSSLPAELPPEAVCALVDTREQTPLCLEPLRTEPATLPEGDYSVKGSEHSIIVERKSLGDLVACCGGERERFVKEIHRLLSYSSRLLVVEASWADLERGEWRGNINPNVVMGSLLSWQSQGLPVLLAGNHAAAGKAVARFLYLAAKHRYHECRSLAAAIVNADEADNG